MNDSLPDETQITNEMLGLRLLDAHQYWLKKRLLFNILVGVAGLASFILFIPAFNVFDCVGALIWGLVANGLYSLGYVCESYIITRIKQYEGIKQIREWVFWSGTLLYIIVSIIVPFLSTLSVSF